MNGFLLDTNVVSETTKPEPASQVAAILTTQNDLWRSVIVLHELEFGSHNCCCLDVVETG